MKRARTLVFVSSGEDMMKVEVCRCPGTFDCMWSTTCVQLCSCVVSQSLPGVGSLVCHCIGRSCSVVSWRRCFGKASVPFSRGLLFVCTERCSLEQCLRGVFSKYLLCLSLLLRSALFFSLRVVIEKMCSSCFCFFENLVLFRAQRVSFGSSGAGVSCGVGESVLWQLKGGK